MATPRDVLNELKWRYDVLDQVAVWYRHRGAPNDTRIIQGRIIKDLHHSFLELEGPEGGTMIPYHRVLRIDRDGEAIWERRTSGLGGRSSEEE